jgi:hypothetical protein
MCVFPTSPVLNSGIKLLKPHVNIYYSLENQCNSTDYCKSARNKISANKAQSYIFFQNKIVAKSINKKILTSSPYINSSVYHFHFANYKILAFYDFCQIIVIYKNYNHSQFFNIIKIQISKHTSTKCMLLIKYQIYHHYIHI